MKKALLIALAVLAILGLTNPSLSAHREALEQKELGGLAGAGLDGSSPLIRQRIAQTVARRVGRRNYGLFSLTTVSYADTLPESAPVDLRNRTVGVGVLGFVYLWGQM